MGLRGGQTVVNNIFLLEENREMGDEPTARPGNEGRREAASGRRSSRLERMDRERSRHLCT